MDIREQGIQWAMELQSIAQAGLYYTEGVFDRERYERIREIAAEMLSCQLDLPLARIKELFCNEIGYQTPKLDVRAAVFQNDKILLVRELTGKWALPGGWVDMDKTVKESAVKEAKEEAGVDVTADRIIALHDWRKHNVPIHPFNIFKIFVLCSLIGGEFEENTETVESGYFGLDELPELSVDKTSKEQIRMCFEAGRAKHWATAFD